VESRGFFLTTLGLSISGSIVPPPGQLLWGQFGSGEGADGLRLYHHIRSAVVKEVGESVGLVGLEDPGRLGDVLDLLEETVAAVGEARVLQRVGGEQDHEPGTAASRLAAENSPHALDHLTAGTGGADHDPQIGVGHVDALVENPRCGDGVEGAVAQVPEDAAPVATAGAAGDDVDLDVGVEPHDRMVGGPHRLGEQQGPVGGLDGRSKPAERLELRRTQCHDLASGPERGEILARGAATGTGVVLRQMADRGQERPERGVGNSGNLPQNAAGFDDLGLGGVVFVTLLTSERDRYEGYAGLRTHALGDGVDKPVAVADTTEIGEQDRLNGVVGALEGGGQPEALGVFR